MVLGQFFCRFTGSAAQLEHTACARRHGPQLVSKKFLEEEIFAEQIFASWHLIAKIAKISASRKFPAIRYIMYAVKVNNILYKSIVPYTCACITF